MERGSARIFPHHQKKKSQGEVTVSRAQYAPLLLMCLTHVWLFSFPLSQANAVYLYRACLAPMCSTFHQQTWKAWELSFLAVSWVARLCWAARDCEAAGSRRTSSQAHGSDVAPMNRQCWGLPAHSQPDGISRAQISLLCAPCMSRIFSKWIFMVFSYFR